MYFLQFLWKFILLLGFYFLLRLQCLGGLTPDLWASIVLITTSLSIVIYDFLNRTDTDVENEEVD